jgi:putative SOS response-associated peptidase YedK
MCGRFTQRSKLADLARDFQARLAFADEPSVPRYNIAPTQVVPVVRQMSQAGGRELAMLWWGLIPSWAKDPKIGNQTINARGESVAEKPAFRAAFKRRRCLILADGYYEWQKLGKIKQPHFIHRADDAPFAFAGLWETWRGGAGKEDANAEALETCTIITTTANDLMRPLHDRMPVILYPRDYDLWLDPAVSDRERLDPLIAPHSGEDFVATPVSTYVNNARHEGAECLAKT